MARYIDVDLLIGKIDEVAFEIDDYSLIIDAVEQAPTADVREVRRGKWIRSVFAGDFHKCSECNGVWNRKFDFCPNCGAEMEVE